MVLGVSEDKDVDGICQELLPRVRRVITTQSIHPRAMDAETLVDLVHRAGRSALAVTPIESAVVKAIEEAAQEAVVLITGSVSVAAAAREILMESKDDSAE